MQFRKILSFDEGKLRHPQHSKTPNKNFNLCTPKQISERKKAIKDQNKYNYANDFDKTQQIRQSSFLFCPQQCLYHQLKS